MKPNIDLLDPSCGHETIISLVLLNFIAPTKSLAQILRKFLWKGPEGMNVIKIVVFNFMKADSESLPMT